MLSTCPKVDVKEDKNAYTMQMDLPGMTEKDVNVELDITTYSPVSSHHEENKRRKER